MKSMIGFVALILALISIAQAKDPGWPRQMKKDGATLIIYQPQVDSWNNFTDLEARFAFSVTPPAGKPGDRCYTGGRWSIRKTTWSRSAI